MYEQEKYVKDFGLSEPRYAKCYSSIISTFCVRTFQNMVPMSIKILEDMKTVFYKERTLSLSNGPSDLFKMFSIVTDANKHCPYKDVTLGIVGLVYK